MSGEVIEAQVLGVVDELINIAPAVGSEPKASTEAPHTTPPNESLHKQTVADVQIASWGANNKRPQDMLAVMDKNGIGKQGLNILQKAHYGGGARYFRHNNTEQGQQTVTIEPRGNTDAELAAAFDFHKRNRIPKYLKQVIMNREYWGFEVHEFVLSNNYQEILSVRCLRSAWCRFEMHNDDGRSEHVVYNPNWAILSLKDAVSIPLADHNMTVAELKEWTRAKGLHKFALCVTVADPDLGYYPNLAWHSLFDSQWLQGANLVPEKRMAWIEKTTTFKYHIRIPGNYFALKFKDQWESFSPQEKAAKEGEILAKLNEWLNGSGKGGTTFITGFSVDDGGNEGPKWEIDKLDDKPSDGILVPDSEKNNSEILATMAVDPTLLGQGAPGGKLGAGSGSDKRAAFNILNILMQSDREDTVAAWQLISEWNGWPEWLCLGIKHTVLETLDVNPTGQKTTAAT